MSSLICSTVKVDQIRSRTDIPAINIDSVGRLLSPNKPVFYGWRDTGSEAWENFGTTPVTYTYNIAVTNIGGCYNTSTGIFTCPVSGIYAVCPGVLSGQAGSYSTQYVYVNGVNKTARGCHTNLVGNNHWTYNSQTFLVSCNANDLLEVRIAMGAATTYGREHCHGCIWLHS